METVILSEKNKKNTAKNKWNATYFLLNEQNIILCDMSVTLFLQLDTITGSHRRFLLNRLKGQYKFKIKISITHDLATP